MPKGICFKRLFPFVQSLTKQGDDMQEYIVYLNNGRVTCVEANSQEQAENMAYRLYGSLVDCVMEGLHDVD